VLRLPDSSGSSDTAAIELAARMILAHPITRSARRRNNNVLGISIPRGFPAIYAIPD